MRLQRLCFLILIVLFTLQVGTFAAYVPNQVIVKFNQPIHRMVDGRMQLREVNIPLETSAILKKIGAVPLERFDEYSEATNAKRAAEVPAQFQNLYKMQVALPVDEALDYLSIDPSVEYAEPNYYVQALDTTPNDPKYSEQWGLPKVSAPAAWDYEQGNSSIIVAVIDTGVNYNHEDLTGKVTLGWDFVNGDSNPNDDNGHGSGVAGVIGASTNNGIGIAGLGWNTRILAVKVLHSTGTGEVYDVAQGIQYSADRAHILNLSLGDYDPTTTLQTAVDYAVAKGCVLVGAAGNDGKTDMVYPAAYDSVLAVAATDSSDKRAVWNSTQSSNYGTWISVCAPGTNIYSTRLNNSYSSPSGTSMATPFVSALAALILAQNPTWSAAQIKEQIISTADNIDSVNIGYTGKLGSGRINAASAVRYPLALISSPTASQIVSGTISITGSAAGGGFNYYKVEVGVGASPTTWTQLGNNHTTQATDNILETWETSPGANGAHVIKLTVNASLENTYEVQVDVQNALSIVNNVKLGPNPFNPRTGNYTIQFDLSTSATVTIYIYDITGSLVWQNTQARDFGINNVIWDGRNRYGTYVGNGVYLLRIASSDNTLLGSGKILVY
ncbi:MAG: S8 family serine peptidase [Candidatus Margulisbacteria bacterium]|nr:S8 family serine peptidase [Candidatus Margulisiibacteriota bacterium]MBU1021871.1 S8 family serine peptidase [Candidatus Margulisiibacteriota bacterium]MBU1728509.1 S8 family serine peptidase [Candidatus Margulisiibacteriota bacterium]MBU1954656.1 S8 family serine peptidase [Candidatus Margulisiibacteriota bacterium]